MFVVGLALSAALVARKVKGRPADRDLGLDGPRDHRERGSKDLSIWANGIAAIPDKVVDTPDFGLLGDFSFGFFNVLGFATASPRCSR